MPPLTPSTSPVVVLILMVASEVLQIPPAGVLLSVMLLFTHTADGPLIAAGSPFTVTTAVLVQPVPVIV